MVLLRFCFSFLFHKVTLQLRKADVTLNSAHQTVLPNFAVALHDCLDPAPPFTYSGFFKENKFYMVALELERAQLHELYTFYEDT